MRVLIIHNRYREPGGEDLVVAQEAQMLRDNGVDVRLHEADNIGSTAKLALGALWSRSSYTEVRDLCERIRPDVAHVHNFWMKLSPAVHSACHAAGVPTVQTLHNFRLLCANALLLRDQRPCEDCIGTLPWRGVHRRCYHGSLLHSAAVAAMITTNRVRGTWLQDVDAYITPSHHSAERFRSGGIPSDRLFVKPNATEDPGANPHLPSASDTILYVGRLSPEKGLSFLISAWHSGGLAHAGRLVVIGDGPESAAMHKQAADYGLTPDQIIFMGRLEHGDVTRHMARCRAVVLPSLCYETFGRTVVEAFSLGRPVIVTSEGAAAEMVQEGDTGFSVPPGDVNALATALRRLLENGRGVDVLGCNARDQYLRTYTPDRNFEQLIQVYRFARRRRSAASVLQVLSSPL